MKHKSIFSLFAFLLGLGLTTTSCEDMLTPDLNRYAENFSGKDTVYFYHGILRNVQDMIEQNELLSDLRSDLVTTTSYSSDSISPIINYERDKAKDGDSELLNRAAYYKVINQCNFYLAKVDTMARKNNLYYMRKEYAQVVNIRAWTYMQLVQTYGRVPYITEPVDNASTGWETNPSAWATPDNLLTLLKPELLRAQAYEHTLGYPNYGSYSTGSGLSISSQYFRFYSDLILGDLYLMSAKSKSDYIEAAKNYYYFLKEQARSDAGYTAKVSEGTEATASQFTSSNSTRYSYSIYSWVNGGLGASGIRTTENISLIMSAANSSFGKVMSRVAQIYGFDPHSTNSTNTTTGSDGDEITTSGTVTVTTNYKSRQVAPSQAYINLCKSQSYTYPTLTNNELVSDVKFYDCGDVRMNAAAPLIKTKEGTYRYITRYTPITSVTNDGEAISTPSFKYTHSLYRTKQVYLRYAEAINRAGYPRLAFAVLRNGLDDESVPMVADSVHYDHANKTKQTVYYVNMLQNIHAANYIGADELRRIDADPQKSLYLDFSSTNWHNYGIHEQGCGTSTDLDSLYSYSMTVSQRIEDEAKRTNTMTAEVESLVKRLRSELHLYEISKGSGTEEGGTTTNSTRSTDEGTGGEEGGDGGEVEVPDTASYTRLPAVAPIEATTEEINAVETLIADECAMEMPFEGNRMFDLIRFALHKDNDPGLGAGYGTEWLAWKIARRAEDYAPYENVNVYNATLYNLLKVSDNWFIRNPEYDE